MIIDLVSERHATPLEENGTHNYQYIADHCYTDKVNIYK